MPPPRARDLLALTHSSPSVVSADASAREVVARLLEDPPSYEAYVVDAEGRFFGVVTAQRVAEHLFTHQKPKQMGTVHLLDVLSAESAEHMAVQKAPCVHPDDSLSHVIDVMFEFDLIEIPVIDDDGFIVGSLNLLDILAAWREDRLFS